MLIRGAARARSRICSAGRMRERDPAVTTGQNRQGARSTRSTAPLVIAVGAHWCAAQKVPELEQLLSAAAGVMNLLNAFHLQGYGANPAHRVPNAYDPRDRRGTGFAAR